MYVQFYHKNPELPKEHDDHYTEGPYLGPFDSLSMRPCPNSGWPTLYTHDGDKATPLARQVGGEGWASVNPDRPLLTFFGPKVDRKWNGFRVF